MGKTCRPYTRCWHCEKPIPLGSKYCEKCKFEAEEREKIIGEPIKKNIRNKIKRVGFRLITNK